MRRESSTVHFSPTDLAQFMESRFASWMSRYALDHPETKRGRDRTDADAVVDADELLKRRGQEHEQRVLEGLRADGRDVVEISAADRESEQRETLGAMEAGREIIYQARLVLGPLGGIADFTLRVPGASGLGDFHYEAWDAKLAHRGKPGHLIQLCAYSEMLEAAQQRRPERCGLYLGNGKATPLRVADYFYFYRRLRDAFVEFLATYDADRPPLPDPSDNHRDWQQQADRRLEELDHISRVARVSRRQIQRLARRGVETLTGLADAGPEAGTGMPAEVFARLVEQARLQRDSAGQPRPRYRVLDPTEVQRRQGLAVLPPPSPGDVFFDLEGNPLAEGGLEYLWGAVTLGPEGEPVYRDWWAHSAGAERRAAEQFIDWLTERRARTPDMHVYHYAAYEVVALRRLVAREVTREDEFDELLRQQVFVDLYTVVHQGVRVGEPSYSLKNVERLYLPPRTAAVASGMESVAYYEAWLQRGEPPDWKASPLLRQIRDYNEEDCLSTLGLARWLWERQRALGIAFEPPAEPEAPADPLTDREIERQRQRGAREALAKAMLADLPEPADRGDDPERWQIQELLAQLLQFHRREERPVWWELFHRAAMTEDERIEQPDCLAGLVRTGGPTPIKRSIGFEYRFDPEQDTKISQGDRCRVAEYTRAQVTIDEKDDAAGRIVLKISRDGLSKADLDELPARLCLIRFDLRSTELLEESIKTVCDRWMDDRSIPPALRGLLLRQPPRVAGHAIGSVIGGGEDIGATLLRVVRNLEGSDLCVQGPPGTGKTTVAARVIVELLGANKRIGITSNSHRAVVNLMEACANANGGALDCAKIGGNAPEDRAGFPGALDGESADAAGLLARTGLIGGTAWCFARGDLAGMLDYLFVDEAGQVSLANVVAMSRSARNIILLGDQMQLSQPTRGTHPGESALSALDYALCGHASIPPERGLFLPKTYRLHPELCEFISGAFYAGVLRAAAGNERRRLLPGPAGGLLSHLEAGLVFVPVSHEGNRQASREESDAITRLTRELLGRPLADRDGGPDRAITRADILIVAPYNLQVRRLQAALPGFRVGTVDKFQGQEAPIVLISMCASDADQSPRGMGFLLDPNRLNVAISRAQCLAVVVGEIRLAGARCASVRELELVNRMCRIVGRPAAAG